MQRSVPSRRAPRRAARSIATACARRPATARWIAAARILDEFARAGWGASGAAPAPADSLTLREHEVLELVAQRYTNKEIAQKLVLSEYTVKNHLSNILSKLQLRSRAEAARLAASPPRRLAER